MINFINHSKNIYKIKEMMQILLSSFFSLMLNQAMVEVLVLLGDIGCLSSYKILSWFFQRQNIIQSVWYHFPSIYILTL